MDYFLTVDGLVRSRDKIYVPDSNELKKVIFEGVSCETICKSPRLVEGIDHNEEILLLAESKEGCSRVHG